jgi:uncharacterized membrane protein YphA (DoxX/SURF4 family)
MPGGSGYAADFIVLLLRLLLGVVFLAHGWNHIFGGGWPQLILAAGLGLAGGLGQVAAFWRPAGA